MLGDLVLYSHKEFTEAFGIFTMTSIQIFILLVLQVQRSLQSKAHLDRGLKTLEIIYM